MSRSQLCDRIKNSIAGMAKLVYAQDLKFCDRKIVWVRVPLSAQTITGEDCLLQC